MGMMSNRFANLCLTNLCRRNFSNTALSLQRKKKFTKAQLIVKLSALEYHVTQEKGTEWAWTGRYLDEKRTGSYKCIVCATKLFDSETKEPIYNTLIHHLIELRRFSIGFNRPQYTISLQS